MGRQENGRIRFLRKGFRFHLDGKGAHPEVHNTVSALFTACTLQTIPCGLDRLAIDRIVSGFQKIGFGRDNDRVRLDTPAGAVKPTEALAQAIERRGFRDKGVKIDVHARLDALRGDEDQRLIEIALGAGADRSKPVGECVPIHRPGRADQQQAFRFFRAELFRQVPEHRSRAGDTIDYYPYDFNVLLTGFLYFFKKRRYSLIVRYFLKFGAF